MGSASAAKPELRVIVVDDDPLDAKLLEMSLSATIPCQVVVVNTRELFLMELEQTKPDIIISDSNVPGFDGTAARALALKHYPQVPFIFYSGADAVTLEAKAVKLGAHAWLQKKDLDRIGDMVRDLCR